MKKTQAQMRVAFGTPASDERFAVLLDAENNTMLMSIWLDLLEEEFQGAQLIRMENSVPLDGMGADHRVQLLIRWKGDVYQLFGKGNTLPAAYVSAMTGGQRVLQQAQGPDPSEVPF